MVRESQQIIHNVGSTQRKLYKEGWKKIIPPSFLFSFLSILLSLTFWGGSLFAADSVNSSPASKKSESSSSSSSRAAKGIDSRLAATEAAADSGEDKKTLVLKLMIVNPSKKHKQIYPMKAYLPEEIQPQHLLSKEDMEVGYDPDKKAYYVSKQLELDPGQSVVKTIKVEDIWQISETQLHEVSEEASQLYKKVEGTPYEEKARLLLSNMEVLLTQIYEQQNDTSLTPEEHISAYRDNKNKLREIELDMIAMRRIVMQATGESSPFSMGSEKAGAGFMGASFNPEVVDRENKGSLPEWIAWRAIFIILIFLGLGAASFYLIWHRQMIALEKRKKLEAAQNKPQSVFEDVLGQASVESEREKLDNRIVIPSSADTAKPKK